jgi:BirA family biotin operon repressor/biotin-[acetyl-CoA-carboxylase] ligase
MLDLSACVRASLQAQPEMFGLLSLLGAACTSEGIRKDTGVASWLHWPNLVTIDGRVVAKTSLSVVAPSGSDGDARVVFAISVNCFADAPAAFPPGLPATSILGVLGVQIDVGFLRDKVLHALDWYFAEWQSGLHQKLVERMTPNIEWLGRDVEVMASGGRQLRGRAKGLDDLGSLVLEQRDRRGRQKTIALPPETVELVRKVN